MKRHDNELLKSVSALDEHTTWGFVQAGLDPDTSAVCIAVLWFGLDGILLGF